MKNLKTFIILMAIIGVTGILGNAFAVSQPKIECQSGNICVHPGDSLTYSINFKNTLTTETYTFGDYIGTDKVNLSITTNFNGTKTQLNNILNLNTGFFNETADGGGIPVLVILPTPIYVDKTLAGVSEVTQNFNDSPRVVITHTNNTSTADNELEFDKETGVLMYLHIIPKKATILNGVDIGLDSPVRYDLINTNMFASSSAEAELQIPTWIKNNAKWWSEGQIEDADFVKGVQYLVQQEIIKIPNTQSDSNTSQQIPRWVKTNAGWWASGQIPDSDFIKGIEYLVNNGIIRV